MKGYLALSTVRRVIGAALPLGIWFVLSESHFVPDRYLPTISEVFTASADLEPSLSIHVAYTAVRLMIGFLLGTGLGVLFGMACARSNALRELAEPFVQSTRSVPGVALIPFFLLWFGFSEFGRYLLVVAGISFNIAIATIQILRSTPETYRIMFSSFGQSHTRLLFRFMLPYSIENLLPTLRFSLASAIGLIVTSELLGSQVGLGYLVQTSVNTFSFRLVFLVAIVLGLVSVCADYVLVKVWRRLIFWRAT